MRIISFIKEHQIIRDILDHLGIWLVNEFAAVDLHHQTHADDFYGDLDYSWDEYIQS